MQVAAVDTYCFCRIYDNCKQHHRLSPSPNAAFDVKRNMIISMDRRGQYIPFCTKMVFLKYYTPSAENQLHFWGQADRVAYVQAINEVLKEYLKPIPLEKEEV